ncbi:aminotransferase class I/II-fold pyridoxal phosphate-dependent enzyme [bacterium]|nr:aminotransferase class I/II-fold pyridoxal phosphate-dependent enzyme [bacterium]
MAGGLVGSEILKIAADIRAMVADGQKVCNLTVGDFNPSEFRIPEFLEKDITRQYQKGQTNYPPSDGVMELRKAVQQFYSEWLHLQYPEKSIIVTGGARPVIYGIYRAVVDPGEKVVYPTPSWNNNHYVHMVGAKGVAVPCSIKTSFLPTRDLLKDAIKDAVLLSLNSPLNPTGTAFTRDVLEGICDLVLEENRRRGKGVKPLYVMYDQVYWMLTFGKTDHYNPVSLRPEIAPYVIFVDAISKSFAATGVRVGWSVGPQDVIERMSAILGHVGAWAPRAEQLASSELLLRSGEIIQYHQTMKAGVQSRLELLYNNLMAMKSAGLAVDAIEPMGAIYLTAQFNLIGKNKPGGGVFTSNEEIRQYLLHEAQVAVVPFQAFAHAEQSGWFRLSVGAVSLNDIETMVPKLKTALGKIK